MNLAHSHLPKPVVGCCFFLIFLASPTSRDEVHRLRKPIFGGRISGSDVSNSEWEWNCGTANHPDRVSIAGSWEQCACRALSFWECLFPGSWDRDIQYGPWEGEIGPATGTSPRLLVCQSLAEQGWFMARVCHPLSRTLQLWHEVPGMLLGRRGSPGLCSHSLCAPASESRIQPWSCCCA